MLRLLFYFARYRVWLALPVKRSLLLSIALLPLYCIPPKRVEAQYRLRLFFQAMGPVFIKFGQFLSTRPDLVPASIVNDLMQLQSNVAPFATPIAKQLITAELKNPLDAVFVSMSENPVASGSLAQVYRAQTIDGNTVAIKILRPNIQAEVDKNIRFLQIVTRLVYLFYRDAKRLRFKELVADYSYFIQLECNLMNEASNSQRLRHNFKNNPIHDTPKVYWQWTTKNLLTMSWVDAIAVTDIEAIKQHNIDLKQLAETGVTIFFTQVFEHNLFHADMHPGNIFIAKNTPSVQYIAVDCAVMGSHDQKELLHLALLWLNVFKRDYQAAAKVMIRAKWLNSDTDATKLTALIARLFEPMADKAIKDVPFSLMLLDLFEQSRPFGLHMRPNQMLLQKTLINIEGLGKQIYPELNLFAIAIPFLEKWLRQQLCPQNMAKKVMDELIWRVLG